MALLVYSFVIGLAGGLVSGLAAVAMIWKQLGWLHDDLANIKERLERLEARVPYADKQIGVMSRFGIKG